MKKRTMSWGTWPTYEEFERGFRANVPQRNTGGRYGIAYGLGGSDEYDPSPGSYDARALWTELERLWVKGYVEGGGEETPEETEKFDRATSWVSDILGTLGFEWI